MASIPDLFELGRSGLPATHALHPSLGHLAACDADGNLQIVDLATRQTLASINISIAADTGRTLALGGSPERPLAAWIDGDGHPVLWAYLEDAPGLAAEPTAIESLDRHLHGLAGASYEGVWITGAEPRAWVVFSMSSSGALVSNGRITSALDPGQQVIGVGASPSGRRLALILSDGRLILIEDPETEPSESDALGPALLIESDVACPLFTLRPHEARLPIGAPRKLARTHRAWFTPTARARFLGETSLFVTYTGPDPEHKESQKIVRRHIGISLEDGPEMISDESLPMGVDFELQVLAADHPLAQNHGSVWLSPQPNGAMLHAPGESRPLRFVDPESLVTAHLSGHPTHLEALRALGLRWDGAEIHLDTLRPDHLRRHKQESPWPTGPISPDIAFEGDHQTLVAERARADRVLLFRPRDATLPRVLYHPVLTLIPDEIRARKADRPHVDLLSMEVDAAEAYLGMWRRPGGLELWSLRAGDRLKAWSLPSEGDHLRHICLFNDDPDYLPTIFALEARGALDAPDTAIVVHTVEFGDASVTRLGALRVPGLEALEQLHPFDIEGRSWRGPGGTFEMVEQKR